MPNMATPLRIGETERASLRALRVIAAQRPVDALARMRSMGDQSEKAKYETQLNEQSVYIPLAFLVTYTVQINHPMGAARHLSISSQVPGRIPDAESVWAVAKELGFEGGPDDCSIYTTGDQPGEKGAPAVNVVQAILTTY